MLLKVVSITVLVLALLGGALLLSDLEPLASTPRHVRACGHALVALAASDPGNAEPRIRKGMEADDETLRRIATEAFALLNGLRDIHDDLRQKQLARLARSSDEDLEDVEEEFPELPRDVDKLLLLYAIANKEAFR